MQYDSLFKIQPKWLISIVMALLTACKSNEEIAQEKGAYIRFINLTPENTRFYFNEIVNVNGDTAVYNFNNELYKQITTDYTGIDYSITEENQPPEASINLDLKNQTSPGVYAWAKGGSNYFPNATHRVDLGLVVNNINYHKWARVKAGSNELTFRPSRSTIIDFQPSIELLPISYEAEHFFEANQYYTLLLAPVRLSSNDIIRNRLVIVNEDLEQTFNDSSAYIRFINFTDPSDRNEQLNVRTESIDIYFIKKKLDSNGVYQDLSSEVSIQENLQRFEINNGAIPYFEIDMSDVLQESVKAPELVSNYAYEFRFYRKGDNQQRGQVPINNLIIGMSYSLAQGLTLQDLTTPGLTPDQRKDRGQGFFLLARDINRFQPTITTVILNIQDIPFVGIITKSVTYNLERTNAVDAYFR